MATSLGPLYWSPSVVLMLPCIFRGVNTPKWGVSAFLSPTGDQASFKGYSNRLALFVAFSFLKMFFIYDLIVSSLRESMADISHLVLPAFAHFRISISLEESRTSATLGAFLRV